MHLSFIVRSRSARRIFLASLVHPSERTSKYCRSFFLSSPLFLTVILSFFFYFSFVLCLLRKKREARLTDKETRQKLGEWQDCCFAVCSFERLEEKLLFFISFSYFFPYSFLPELLTWKSRPGLTFFIMNIFQNICTLEKY